MTASRRDHHWLSISDRRYVDLPSHSLTLSSLAYSIYYSFLCQISFLNIYVYMSWSFYLIAHETNSINFQLLRKSAGFPSQVDM